ncbi:MAG: type II secretion system protein [Planctomycetota bacterium]|nr:type II secretion system protein [Planctomycetota bacterium]
MNATRNTSARHGFTMIELIVAMAIFTMLGSMVVFLMRQGLDIFDQGTREAALYDRLDNVLPIVEQDLKTMQIVRDTDPPPLSDERDPGAIRRESATLPPPPVNVRLRSTHIPMKTGLAESDGRYGYMMPYFAFVADMSEGADPLFSRLPTGGGPDAKDVTPENVEAATDDTIFKPTGGQVEIVYIAVPEDPNFPSILTLYRGYRAPIGHPTESLLLPENFDTLKKIQKRCRPVATGLLHFGVTWRRIFATSWEPATQRAGMNGEQTRYVGPHWDSTRGADTKWALHAGKQSLVDPSDDIFPAFVRLEIALASPTSFGFGRGDGMLTGTVGKDAREIPIDNPDDLVRPQAGGPPFVKVGIEWMRVINVDYQKRTARVERGVRGTKATDHDANEWTYIGLPAASEVKLPVYRDRFTLPKEGAR